MQSTTKHIYNMSFLKETVINTAVTVQHMLSMKNTAGYIVDGYEASKF